MISASQIKEHMGVIASDGQKICNVRSSRWQGQGQANKERCSRRETPPYSCGMGRPCRPARSSQQGCEGCEGAVERGCVTHKPQTTRSGKRRARLPDIARMLAGCIAPSPRRQNGEAESFRKSPAASPGFFFARIFQNIARCRILARAPFFCFRVWRRPPTIARNRAKLRINDFKAVRECRNQNRCGGMIWTVSVWHPI
jgi:hypothetical protein